MMWGQYTTTASPTAGHTCWSRCPTCGTRVVTTPTDGSLRITERWDWPAVNDPLPPAPKPDPRARWFDTFRRHREAVVPPLAVQPLPASRRRTVPDRAQQRAQKRRLFVQMLRKEIAA